MQKVRIMLHLKWLIILEQIFYSLYYSLGHGSRYIIQVDDFYKEVFCNEKHCSLIKGTREYTNQAF